MKRRTFIGGLLALAGCSRPSKPETPPKEGMAIASQDMIYADDIANINACGGRVRLSNNSHIVNAYFDNKGRLIAKTDKPTV